MRKKSFKRLLIDIFVWAFVILALLPVYWIVSTSIKPEEMATRMPPVLLFVPTLKTYLNIFIEKNFLSFLMNSIIVSFFTLLISILFGTLAAYAIARNRSGGRFLTFSILVVQMIPPMAISFPLFIFIQSIGLIDTRSGLVLAELSFTLPFIIWIMRQFFLQVPIEIEESAKIDGASIWRIFFYIMLPVSMPGLISAGIFTFFNSWNEFLYPLVLTMSRAQTATIASANYITTYDILWTHINAASTILMIPPIVLTIFLRKYIVSGLVGESVKG